MNGIGMATAADDALMDRTFLLPYYVVPQPEPKRLSQIGIVR